MYWLTDERLFYGGAAVAAVSLILTLITVCVSQIRKAKLNAELDAEYGPRDKNV